MPWWQEAAILFFFLFVRAPLSLAEEPSPRSGQGMPGYAAVHCAQEHAVVSCDPARLAVFEKSYRFETFTGEGPPDGPGLATVNRMQNLAQKRVLSARGVSIGGEVDGPRRTSIDGRDRSKIACRLRDKLRAIVSRLC